MRRGVVAAVLPMVLACVGAATASSAGASPGIVPGTFQARAINRDGTTDTTAGSHPYAYTASFEFTHDKQNHPDGNARILNVTVPAGFVGNPTAAPRCQRHDFDGELANCPPSTQIGTLSAQVVDPSGTQTGPTGALYNLVPPEGFAASFGFQAAGFNVVENASLIHGGQGGYRVAVTANVPKEGLLSATQTIWGVPADKSHDSERECINAKFEHVKPCSIELQPRPFLTMPTNCEPELPTLLEVAFAEAPTEFFKESAVSPQMVGCEALDFGPTIAVQPETNAAATPTGLRVDVHMPQAESAEGLSEAHLKNAVVRLPQGMVVNPSSANGLASCSSSQIGLENTAQPGCPAGSQLGTVEVDTPLINHPLPGVVYLASQGDNPFGSLLAIYVVVDDPATGIVVKLAGHVELNATTGQLTTTFDDNPQFPFEDFKLDFTGGPRAPLIMPETCGTKTSEATLTPWSMPEGHPVSLESSFAVTSIGTPGGCYADTSQAPNNPVLSAGTQIPLAGAYSPFVTAFSREDGSQPLSSLTLTLPAGVAAKIAGVQECSDAQIAQAAARDRLGEAVFEKTSPSCPATSRIGTDTAGVGAGTPLQIKAPIYFAGPYKGAPFSLAIITPILAGPYDLGVIVVRAAIYIDPQTAQVTVKTDPIPSIIDGVPTDLKIDTATIDREHFTLNPTSCETTSIAGELTSTTGNVARAQNRFQVGGCTGLQFKPVFKVITSGKTSRKNGANLHVVLTYPNAPEGTQTNIKSVHVELPKALPSRLSTLNHACVDSVFNQNPANCPPESGVGVAKAVTPILPVPLEGPAYFVSHGGQKFPDLVVVLQGYGVTVDLQGETFISKAGITSSTFKSVPDVPVGSFELTLPEGSFSALGANRDLCSASLSMPTVFDAQNGARLEQDTPIEVQGCPYSLRIVGRRVHRGTLTLKVSVPVAGKLVASGKGVWKAAKSAKSRQTLTLTLKERQGGKLRTSIALRFTPASPAGEQRGKKSNVLRKSLTVTFR